MTIILDPTASLVHDIADPGPDAGDLHGRKIAVRIDMLWRSWDWVSEIWAERLRAEGAEVTFWRSCGRTGEEGEQADREYQALLAQSDMAIVGLDHRRRAGGRRHRHPHHCSGDGPFRRSGQESGEAGRTIRSAPSHPSLPSRYSSERAGP